MSNRPDIAAALAPGEGLLWQGAPLPGRRVSDTARRRGRLAYVASALVLIAAWYVAVFHGHTAAYVITAYALMTSAALLAFAGLRLGILTGRRLRAQDAITAYAITDRRVFVLAGPYKTEVGLDRETSVNLTGDGLTIVGPNDQIHFERLDDAAKARDILMRQIEGQT